MSNQIDSQQLPNQLKTFQAFPEIEQIIDRFQQAECLNLNLRKRFRLINSTLCQLIQESPPSCFLLAAVIDYFNRVNQLKILNDPLTINSFEFWLNHFSGCSEEENYAIRGKIIGKMIPRDEYQVFFPIGMNKSYPGSHFIAAHLSPDVDTMVASFWGWADAFAARVGTGLHRWSLPGGPPDSPFTSLFKQIFGETVFEHLARSTPTLTLSAIDLTSQKHLRKELGSKMINAIEHASPEETIILVDQQGYYLGDWRSSDAELVRQIIILFKASLHWFENHILSCLISLFAKTDLSTLDLPLFNASIFEQRIKQAGPVKEFNEKQLEDLHGFLAEVLGIENGINGTFADLNKAFKKQAVDQLDQFKNELEALHASDIFDEHGKLREDRTKLFCQIQKLIKSLDQAMYAIRNHVERLDLMLKTKYRVLRIPAVYISLYSDVEEMRQKMVNREFLTVVINEPEGNLFPVGIIRARDLKETGLGTTSLRDFCNLEEVKMASYLEVISVIDHHKSSLRTLAVPTAIIGDTQSCNVLIAEKVFEINDKYGIGNMSLSEIDEQIKPLSTQAKNPSEIRILSRLLRKKMVALSDSPFNIHPNREYTEYACFLHAILDDTDLLTKVSDRDLECVAQLLNRLKSLATGKETEIVHFDDIPRDQNFRKAAAKRILQQPDMYSLYKAIYNLREASVEENFILCLKNEYSNIFLDTKIQNGCARVGQTKIFSQNFPFFEKNAEKIAEIWLYKTKEVYSNNPEVDLHLHMISTIASAEEVYHDHIGPYAHQDELWFWIAPTTQGISHLNSFLVGFKSMAKKLGHQPSLEFKGQGSENWKKTFKDNFPNIPQKESDRDVKFPLAILRFDASALNSRKSMITPFLPRLVS
jgi:hypothetical protein